MATHKAPSKTVASPPTPNPTTPATPATPAPPPKRKGRAPIPEDETKEQKLARLGVARVKAATTRIRLVGNLAAYKPTDPQIDKIMTALGEACARVEARLRGTRAEETTFQL